MASNTLNVEISAKLHVDKNTAEACLHLASIYMNEHGLTILQKTNEDGTNTLEFLDRRKA